MALGDYILCCKCEVKLIYDGDRGQREWWTERFGEEPQITCPDCQKETKFVGLTDEDCEEITKQAMQEITGGSNTFSLTAATIWDAFIRAIEAKLREKNGGQA